MRGGPASEGPAPGVRLGLDVRGVRPSGRLIADAGYYAEPDGPAYGDPNLRAAYRRLLGNARLAWANMPGHEAADL